MFHEIALLWGKISHPLYVISVIAFILLLRYSYKHSKRMEKIEEPEDDPNGNSNIIKKFYKYM